MKGHKIRVRPCPSTDPNCSASSRQEVLPSGKNYKDPAYHPASLQAQILALEYSAKSSQELLPLGQDYKDPASHAVSPETKMSTLSCSAP